MVELGNRVIVTGHLTVAMEEKDTRGIIAERIEAARDRYPCFNRH
jgi:hypothetical protein